MAVVLTRSIRRPSNFVRLMRVPRFSKNAEGSASVANF